MSYISHKVRLHPNNQQRTMLVKSCGVVRFVWNWALDEWQNQHNAGEKPDKFKLSQQLNAIKKEQFPWMLDVSQRCTSQPIKNLGNAFDKFFNKKGGYPKFKKKGAHDRFTLEYNKGCNFEVKGKKIRIQKIGWVRLAEPLRFEGKLLWATVSREADKWFVSIQVEIPDLPKLPKTNKAIGIDVGVREYVDSDKNHYPVPRSFRRTERKLRRLQQSLARKQKGSKNREKAKIKVARCHARIKNIRGDWLHKFTTKIIRENGIIGIEDLNVRGMMKNRRLAKSIQDAAFGEFRRQLQYKSEWYGRTLYIADRFYPSSKTCSVCSARTKHLPLHVREWVCSECGTKHHRDECPATNLKNLAVGSTVSACGEFSPLRSPPVAAKVSSSVKQESYTNLKGLDKLWRTRT